MARIAPVVPAGIAPEAEALVRRLEEQRGYRPNLHATLAHNPALLRTFLEMTRVFRQETVLPARLRELAILGVAVATRAPAMWLSHIPIACEAGLSKDQIAGLPVWNRHPAFSETERAVLAFAEAATVQVRVSDAVWEPLRRVLTERECLEIASVVGFYNMVARILEPLEVDVDAEYTEAAVAAMGDQGSSKPT